jgi:hypothetical protein
VIPSIVGGDSILSVCRQAASEFKEDTWHFASHAPEPIRLLGILEVLKKAALCGKVGVLPIKPVARTRKTILEEVRAANIASSPAPTAQPPQPVCRGASPGGHQPDRAEQTVQSFTGASRKTRTSGRSHLKCFWNFFELEIGEDEFVVFR